MRVVRFLSIFSMLLLSAALLVPAAHAGVMDQVTKLDFHEAVQIPGQVLPPGTYWFVLADQGDYSAP